jgi:hypothetical protein
MVNSAMLGRVLFVACAFARAAAAAEPAIPNDAARAVFAEAAALCAADDGKLWGVPLCGPIMLVDPAMHAFAANVNDAQGRLTDAGGVFTGLLPTNQNVANTAVEWGGVRWTQLQWPLPDDPAIRATLLMHECFHRVQPKLPLPVPREADNAHLDTLDGRYLLQLEWRALAQALEAQGERAARAAAEDALRFRDERRQLYPGAGESEAALELNEGLAQYTGVVLGNATPEARTAAALRDLVKHVQDPSFVGSFAYASGPAYGLLLDRFAAGWQRRIAPGDELGVLLLTALKIGGVADSPSQLGKRAARYGGDVLLKAEIARDARRREAAKRNRARFVEGPVLVLGFQHMNIQFDPRSLEPLEGAGTVYATMRVTDDWGVLEVKEGALLKPDRSAVIVPAPAGAPAGNLEAAGFVLALNAGWRLVPGARAGDWTVARGP